MAEKKIILATGTFDLIHPGHIHYLAESKKLGYLLYVIVAHDQTVLKNKGKLPLHSQTERAYVIENLKMVDKVVLGSNGNFMATALNLKPDIISMGWDQNPNIEAITQAFNEAGLEIEFVQIERYGEYSSGKLKQLLL